MSQQGELSVPGAVAVLLAFQLAGESVAIVIAQALPGVAFPGPVIGMAFFLAFLFVRRGPSASADAVSAGILRHLSLLFVPAAVGIVRHGAVLAESGVALALALVLSTVATLLAAVGAFLLVKRWSNDDGA
ncbi:MAG: CidA/LrgA family protein [Rhizobiaceae bacterium]